ncbi:MAG: phosphatase PAP2 family protein [Anaerolineae bacterium]|nr:phosphatase PAP2 family protein [Anaerolineae bacterium]
MDEGTVTQLLPQLPLTRDRRVARWISRFTSPPLLAATGSMLTAIRVSESGAWLWALFSISFTIIVPAAFILVLRKRGKVTDFDVFVREQRFWPYMVSVSCALIAWLVMALAHAQGLFILISAAAAIQAIVMFLVNLKWKISVHASGTACFAVLSWQLFGLPGASLLLAIPLVAWSRVRLGRHTTGQVIAGSALGATLLYTMMKIWG